MFKSLFEDTSKATINALFNVRNTATYSRSYQDFFIVWLILHKVETINECNIKKIRSLITRVLSNLKNIDNLDITQEYYDNFIKLLDEAIDSAPSIAIQ